MTTQGAHACLVPSCHLSVTPATQTLNSKPCQPLTLDPKLPTLPTLNPDPCQVTSSRKYEDRLETLANVRDAGISVCAGGIIGLGEGEMDRVGLIHQLATLPAHPESVPINRLVAVKGTPFEVRPWEGRGGGCSPEPWPAPKP